MAPKQKTVFRRKGRFVSRDVAKKFPNLVQRQRVALVLPATNKVRKAKPAKRLAPRAKPTRR